MSFVGPVYGQRCRHKKGTGCSWALEPALINDGKEVKDERTKQEGLFFDDPMSDQSLARAESALFEHTTEREEALIQEAADVAGELGVMFSASGAVDPGESIRKQRDDAPWSLCRRPWSLMYITANGRVLPCCIAPFSMKGYGAFTLGDATQNSLREIWNGREYQRFRDGLLSSAPPPACANCGLRWSL